MPNSNKKHWLPILLLLFGAALAAAATVSFLLIKNDRMKQAEIDGIDATAIVQEVGKLIELPAGEQPNIAVVRDVQKLQDQEIFRKSKNGDVLLIYVEAKRAYLYDRSAHRLVDVAPVNLQ
jgi:hypothetical protein